MQPHLPQESSTESCALSHPASHGCPRLLGGMKNELASNGPPRCWGTELQPFKRRTLTSSSNSWNIVFGNLLHQLVRSRFCDPLNISGTFCHGFLPAARRLGQRTFCRLGCFCHARILRCGETPPAFYGKEGRGT